MSVENHILKHLQRNQPESDLTGWDEYARSFLGFGSWGAQIWFVGIEEAGSPEEMSLRLKYARKQNGEWLWDLAEANAFGFGVPIEKNQQTWTQLLKALVLTVAPDLSGPILHECALNFQSEHFARSNSPVSVNDLFALPKAKSDQLDERYLDPRYNFVNLKAYYQDYRSHRIKHLRQAIQDSSAKIIVFYADKYRMEWQAISGGSFPVGPKPVSFIRDGITYILCDHPTSPQWAKSRQLRALSTLFRESADLSAL